MALNATEDPWILYLREDGTIQSRLMSAALCIRSLWAALGMVFNAVIVYITFANQSLHGICNILIATESFWAILMDAGNHISTVVFVSGAKFITYRTCFPLLFCLNDLPGNLAQLTMMFTGFDRLLSITFPIWYKNRNRWHSFFLIGTVEAFYGLLSIIFYTIDFTNSKQMTLVACSAQDKLLTVVGPVTLTIGLTWSGIITGTYLLIFLFAFVIRTIAKTINDSNRRLVKSLVFIIVMQLFGVFFRMFMKFVFANYWKVDVFFKTPYDIATSFVTIAVYSANAPVLYAFSGEYRKIFNKHFPWLATIFCGRHTNNSVEPYQRPIAAAAVQQHQQQQNMAVNNNNSSSNILVNNYCTVEEHKNVET